MVSKNDIKWIENYEALKAYILQRGHLLDKHVVENRALLSWAKYQRKKIKEGTLDADKRELFESLLATRSNEHTGGGKKHSPNISWQYLSYINVPLEDVEKCHEPQMGKTEIGNTIKMEFTPEHIAELPTLEDVILFLAGLTDDFEDAGGWLSQAMFPPNCSWNLPMVDFFNLADNNQFIVTQTGSKRHTLKPNLRNRPFLYRGQRKDFGGIISGFTRDALSPNGMLSREEAREYHLINNLKAEEFIALLKTHTLFMMLDRGIVLNPERKPIFINMNYYGLAQHYGFHTGLIDFTTDIDAAAFFACTRYLGDDKYEPVTDIEKDPYGVIYVHKILPEATFKYLGFSTIGLQLYPRSGAQKGVCYNEGISRMNVNELV